MNSLNDYRPVELILIDAMNLLARNYNGIKNISYKGKNTGAAFGTARFIINMWKDFNTKNLIFIWEGRNSWRKYKYPFYKSNRKYDRNNDFYECVKGVREILPLFGVKQVSLERYEADDVAGYLLNKNKGLHSLLVSNDWDWWVYLNESIDLWYRNGVTAISSLQAMFERKYNVPDFDVTHIDMFKVITGDSSDGISGIRRFPRKLAAKLAMECSSVYCIMQYLHDNEFKWFKQAKLNYTVLTQNYELIHLNKLIHIDVESTLDVTEGVYNKEGLIKAFNERGMFSLIERL